MRRENFTAGRIAGYQCEAGKQQSIFWDSGMPGLGLRVTATGARSYIFESRLFGKTVRMTIGSPKAWDLAKARTEAARLKTVIDAGQDPRELMAEARAAHEARAAAAAVQAETVGEVWPRYLEEGRPKRKDAWKPRYLADLQAMAAPGGEKKKRGKGTTRPGPLFPLMALTLSELTEDALKAWFDREALAGKHQAARALMMFRGFLRWCAARPEYRALVDRNAGTAASIVEALPSSIRRTDALEAAQVPGWWAGVEQLDNRTASVYLRALLLTGARREEMAALRWENLDFRWRKLTIADKVEATRTIPLTDYLTWLLGTLPRVKDNEFVFASRGKGGRITDTRASHAKALLSAGIQGLTTHGLRRSFSLLGEAAGAPAGAIAQVMGHKPSATAEGYRPRSIDALRPFLQQVERHILELAGVKFDPEQQTIGLRAVK